MSMYLVTGGAGFIGSHIVEGLVGRGERVRVLDNMSTGRAENLTRVLEQVDLVEGDVRDSDDVNMAMQGVSHVLHLAALISVAQSMVEPVATHDVNVTGTLNVLSAARDVHAERVVLASSAAVYGDVADL